MYLSNKTLFNGRDMRRNLLHKEQLYVSALDNGHLQVEKMKKKTSYKLSAYVHIISTNIR